MKRALLVLLVAACGPAPKPVDQAPVSSAAPPPTPAPAPAPVSTAAPAPAATAKKDDLPDEPTSIEPYKVGVTLDPATATTKENVTVTWSLDGGPRAKSVKPFAQVKVEWTDIKKPGHRPALALNG